MVYQPDYVKEDLSDEFDKDKISISIDNGVYVVNSLWAERLLNSVNFEDYDSMQYFQKSLVDSGIIDKLREAGADEGSTVRISDTEFDFID